MTQFNYVNFDTIEIAGMRFYDLKNNKKYPSITTVLGRTTSEEKRQSLENWRKSLGEEEADKRSKEAANRGTKLHLLAERYLKNEPLINDGEDISQKEMGIFNGIKLALNKIDEVWGQEVVLYSDVLEVAGRCDLIGKYKGVPSIIDFKTTTKLKSKSDIEDYFLQTSFYGMAHNELFGTRINNIVILMVNELGFPLEFIEKIDNYAIPLIDRVDFYYDLILKS